ncbi:hypothetical protein MVES1_000306 [Malassezia vespertilionis]|uniref:uncharacterized protein n=1 Tax=Malassezia vespertilionis TaxID=2020962 RepID=UPI0024B1B743|nr:uncharacterized protein MVES1_000306 [Malassezia vespertilionis]WFD04981.1 hypothetical protein MVES1_000306 [Malassezia vespertilionis]
MTTVQLSLFNLFWLVHVIIELPMGLIGFFAPFEIPLHGITPTAALPIRLLACFLIASSVACVLVAGLPDYLPGKRAFAIQIMLFHALVGLGDSAATGNSICTSTGTSSAAEAGRNTAWPDFIAWYDVVAGYHSVRATHIPSQSDAVSAVYAMGGAFLHMSVVQMAQHCVVLGTRIEGDTQQPHCVSLEITLDDYIQPAHVPLDPGGDWLASASRAFVSRARLTQVLDLFTTHILEPLVQQRPLPDATPPQQRPPQPMPVSTARPQTQPIQALNPLRIGDADRDPLAANGDSGPLLGASPSFPGRAPARGDGMLMGPDHPIFHDRLRGPPLGPWGGDGFLPPGAVPPGARFDPVAPAQRPTGNPDWDELRPPGGGGPAFGGFGQMFS